MSLSKADIIHQLKTELLPLEGFKPPRAPLRDLGLGPVNQAFPQQRFPTGAMHEFLCSDSEEAAVTSGFIAGILSALMGKQGVSLWIHAGRSLFPPALKSFGIDPGKIIFVNLAKEKEVLWAMEEALKTNVLSAVIGDIKDLDFTNSRRYQLAVEQSQVTGFILRRQRKGLYQNACLARWKIRSLPSMAIDDLPGVGFPCWEVELLKIRNGKPGKWNLAWIHDSFYAPGVKPVPWELIHQKTG